MDTDDEDNPFEGLADFEVEFFADLVRSYAKLDIGMRGFFYHRIKQVVKETIDLLKASGAVEDPDASASAEPDEDAN